MPHDVNGKLINPGDEVLLRCKVLEVNAGEEFCNVRVESVHGRKPDGLKEIWSSLNTAQLEIADDYSNSKIAELVRDNSKQIERFGELLTNIESSIESLESTVSDLGDHVATFDAQPEPEFVRAEETTSPGRPLLRDRA